MKSFTENKFSLSWIIITFLIGTIFGTGAFWKYHDLQISKKNQELITISKAIELRKGISVIYRKVLDLNRSIFNLDLCSTKETFSADLIGQLRLMEDDFIELERKLSLLEKREPREINLDFAAPCPGSLRFTE